MITDLDTAKSMIARLEGMSPQSLNTIILIVQALGAIVRHLEQSPPRRPDDEPQAA